ncbi:MAG TPA: HAD-IA family hydrolase [Sphingomicrobium sp.]
MSELPSLIFDLDGTLVDSSSILVAIVNDMLRERGSERVVTVDEAAPFLSHGGAALVRGLLADDCTDLVRELADLRERYASQTIPAETLYEGVRAGLHELDGHGFQLGICSNKPEYLCEKVLSDLGLDPLFSAIVGSAPGRPQKPAPDLLNLALERLDTEPARAIMIGDSEVDHALAEGVCVPFLFVSYGYADETWDPSSLRQFSRFPDLVGWLTSRYPAEKVRRVA